MNFSTKSINIEKIIEDNLEFVIPSYQRPYVWDDIEIRKLLEDLKTNFDIKSNEYFVGNTYVIKSLKEKKENQYEVIDGQQRFTTFWMISLCFKTLNIDTRLKDYLMVQGNIRFDFDIRKEVAEYLTNLLDETAEKRISDVSHFEFLKNIAAGIETIKSYLKSEILKKDLKAFGDFINSNVIFIFNEAPRNTDLNALFVALGTSGIQLQQSDILKARVLDKIKEKDRRIIYSKIWESCESMSNFFENNVKLSFSYDTKEIKEHDFKTFSPEKFGSAVQESDEKKLEGLTISEIISGHKISLFEENNENDVPIKCRSIITFNLFLLHVLRIYKRLKNINTDIDSLDGKKLLETFKLNEIDDAAYFIELMWRLRYLFDKYVVKWLNKELDSYDEEEMLLISSINCSVKDNRCYFTRTENEFSNLQMLQSVLYFNNIPNQIWLTPFLYYLLTNETDNEISSDDVLINLEIIDNIMIPGDKKAASWQIMWQKSSYPDIENIIELNLNQPFGTGFNHYWFYKLEYLLWKNWTERDTEKFKRYRITSKNSIEHVFPQNEENKKVLEDECDEMNWLDCLGNLGLLSVGQNSSYSNQDVGKKKIDFNNKSVYDSLKLVKIYSEANWTLGEIKAHQQDMNDVLRKHYSGM